MGSGTGLTGVVHAKASETFRCVQSFRCLLAHLLLCGVMCFALCGAEAQAEITAQPPSNPPVQPVQPIQAVDQPPSPPSPACQPAGQPTATGTPSGKGTLPLTIEWRHLEPGFELAEITPDPNAFQPHTFVLLRIDPQQADFVLLNASEAGEAASLRGWADRASLVAAINASMYLPDARTSTGYMRGPAHTNNPRIVNKFGAFFVAAPRQGTDGLPEAAVLDRDADPWAQRLDAYGIVIQNYRLLNAEGRILWTPGGPSYAISAIGADKAGRIVFIHCREPLTGEAFARMLLDMPLDMRVVMYVEGGPQAGLLVRAGNVDIQWMGRHVADFLTSGNMGAPLPNVLGVRRRTP